MNSCNDDKLLSKSGVNIISKIEKSSRYINKITKIFNLIMKFSNEVNNILDELDDNDIKNKSKNGINSILKQINNIEKINKNYLHNRENIVNSIFELLEKYEIDHLTGLKNRSTLIESGNDLLEKKENLSVILIDLNDFKILNDKYGHDYGDIILKIFSIYLSFYFNSDKGIVFRAGGDEFIIFSSLDNIEKKVLSLMTIFKAGFILPSLENGENKDLNEMINSYNKKIKIEDILEKISFSYGIASKNELEGNLKDRNNLKNEITINKIDDSFGLRTLISLADKRMYEQKKKKI